MQGQVINGFVLKKLLGEGGMAEVWYAENEIGKPAEPPRAAASDAEKKTADAAPAPVTPPPQAEAKPEPVADALEFFRKTVQLLRSELEYIRG